MKKVSVILFILLFMELPSGNTSQNANQITHKYEGAQSCEYEYNSDCIIYPFEQINSSIESDGGSTDSSPNCEICSETDSLALVALYNATDGPNWIITWDLSKPVTDWYGITLNEDCFVTKINMGPSPQLWSWQWNNNNLIGTIPDEISDLSELTYLDFRNNKLEGQILPKLINLTKLDTLDLADNSFEGTLIPELSNLQNLKLLSLSDNNFQGEIPQEIGLLENLSTLNLSENQISGSIPSQLGNVSLLTTLNLRSNNLNGVVPVNIGDLTELIYLDLGDNNLEGQILPQLSNLTNISTLHLSQNSFEGSIIPDISNLLNLTTLQLSDNNFSGELPSDLGTLHKLSYLNLSLNDFEGKIPEELGQLTNLKEFSVSGNQLNGSIPSQLGNCLFLKDLNLSFNKLSGEIPVSIAQLSLWSINLSFNQLEGSLPDGFEAVTSYNLSNNNFSGQVPESLASTGIFIHEINLSNNNFSGSIPFRAFDDISVQKLYFANNDFSGCVENINKLCLKDFNSELDTIVIGTQTYSTFSGTGFNLEGNPKLAWEGALQNACQNQEQIGAPCDDGNSNTKNEVIDENCECKDLSVATQFAKDLNVISIAPNPLIGGDPLLIKMDLNQGLDVQIIILDLKGSVLISQSLGFIESTNTIELDTENLSKGMHILHIISDNNVLSRKIVIQ